MFEGELNKSESYDFAQGSAKAAPLILVVDDHESLLTILRDLLERNGYLVATASSGKEATAWLSTHTPDLIVSDIMMPEVDGYQFFDHVKSEQRLSAIPFVFLTALGNCQEIRNGKALGCDDYLVKPFTPEDLLSSIQGKLRQWNREQKAANQERESYQRRVINTLSHEFRTPLVAIHTGAELLLHNKEVEELPRVRRLIEGIYRGGARLQKLVADFMLLQQILAGSCDRFYRSTAQSTNLKRLIESAVNEFRVKHEETESAELPPIKLELEKLVSAEARVSTHQLIDIITRLLANAVKFGQHKPIEVIGDYAEDHFLVRIRDHGLGLAPDKLQEACATFSQINRDRLEQQGAGLGLSVSSYLAKLNGCQLSFENAPDGGLIATVSFSKSLPQSEAETQDL